MRVNKINAACAAIMIVAGIGTMGSVVATAVHTNLVNIEQAEAEKLNADNCRFAAHMFKTAIYQSDQGYPEAAKNAAIAAESVECK